MKSTVILISGKQGSGKTTLANALGATLQNELPKTYCNQLTFASTIYEVHDSANRILASKGIKRDIVKDGPLLQLLGTEWGRKTIGENVWVDCLKGDVANTIRSYEGKKGYEDAHVVCIVSDCRFKNEFDGIEDAIKIRLECDKEVRMKRCSMWRDNDTHPSEVDLDEYSESGKFDAYFHTDKISVEDSVVGIVELVKARCL